MDNSETQVKHVDYEGAKMGMWIFLFTELLFFGGLFLLYAVYRSQYLEDFHSAAAGLDTVLGAVNTVILITSSLTMALSIAAIRNNDRTLSIRSQAITILLAAAFLVVKYFEWSAKIHHGIYPGSAELLAQSQGHIIFYSLYFVTTGLHGIHVIAGIIIIGYMMRWSMQGKINNKDFIKLENAASQA